MLKYNFAAIKCLSIPTSELNATPRILIVDIKGYSENKRSRALLSLKEQANMTNFPLKNSPNNMYVESGDSQVPSNQ